MQKQKILFMILCIWVQMCQSTFHCQLQIVTHLRSLCSPFQRYFPLLLLSGNVYSSCVTTPFSFDLASIRVPEKGFSSVHHKQRCSSFIPLRYDSCLEPSSLECAWSASVTNTSLFFFFFFFFWTHSQFSP